MTNEEAIEVLKNDIEICTIQQNQACDMAIKALEQTRWIPCSEGLPEDATNGDMIKAVFPNVKVKEKNNGYEVYFGIGTAVQFFNRKWWNTPYNAESEE